MPSCLPEHSVVFRQGHVGNETPACSESEDSRGDERDSRVIFCSAWSRVQQPLKAQPATFPESWRGGNGGIEHIRSFQVTVINAIHLSQHTQGAGVESYKPALLRVWVSFFFFFFVCYSLAIYSLLINMHPSIYRNKIAVCQNKNQNSNLDML